MRTFKRALILVVSVVILISIGLHFMQKKLIFLPTKLALDYAYQFTQPFDEFFIDTEDGAKLNAIHFKTVNPKGVVLYFHGNAGDLSRWGIITSYFTKFNYDVIVMDYRTYGKSTGELTEKNLIKDAQLFYDRTKDLFGEDKIVVYGRSLGANLATFVAANNNPKELILEAPFYNLEEAAQNRIPILLVKYFLKFKFPSNEYITKVTCPIVIIHGTEDGVVPFESGKRLSKKVTPEQLSFVSIPGGEHNNLVEFETYHKIIQKLLK
jgi:alpha-beta hydrolase superfamily lysophospholipase